MTADNDVSGLCKKAQLCIEKGLLDEAVGHLEVVRRLDPQSVEILKLLGTCYLYLKQPEKTLDIFSRIISLDPANAFARLDLHKVFSLTGNYRRAILVLREAMELDSSIL